MPWSNRRTALQNYFAQRREQRHPLTWKAIDVEQECLESAEDAALDEKVKQRKPRVSTPRKGHQ